MGLGDFVSGIKDAAVNVGKGAIWAARPDHWDDIAEGIGKGAEFVVEHPGQVAHIAGEVGKGILKDQLDPVNLAINAGLLAATVATGGAAAPAFIAKLGLGVKSVEAGIEGAKAIETGAEVVKGVQAGIKGAEAVGEVAKGAKAVESGVEAAKAGSTAIRAGETAAEVGQVAQKGGRISNFAQDARQIGSGIKESTGLERVGKVMDAGTELKGAAREAVGLSRYGGQAARRAEWGQRALNAGEDAGKFGKGVSKFAAKKLAGEANPLAAAGTYSKFDTMRHRYNQAERILDTPDRIAGANKAVQVAADPTKAVEDRVTEEIDKNAGTGSGYTDYGQTVTNMYGSPTARGGGSSQTARGGSGSGVAPNMFASAGGSPPGGGGPPGGTAGSAMPSTPASLPNTSSQTANRIGGRGRSFGGDTGRHFWEGPRSQWAGGVQSSYDWRQIDPLRKSPPMRGSRGAPMVKQWGQSTEETTAPATGVARTELNAFGAPANFSPEVGKDGAFAMSTGQNPIGSAFPSMLDAAPKSYTATNVRTAAQPIGAIGPGKDKVGTGVLDVESSSPEDYKFDQAGQGYFDFANMGSGAADVGAQPNASPMYQQGSRTSRRGIGPGTLGV